MLDNQLHLLALEPLEIALPIAGLVVGALAALLLSRFVGVRTIRDAKREADRVLSDARHEAQTQAKQLELDARNELAKRREEFDRETNASRNELKEAERRVTKREDNLDRKLDTLTTKERFFDELEVKIKDREKSVAVKDAERNCSRYASVSCRHIQHIGGGAIGDIRLSHTHGQGCQRTFVHRGGGSAVDRYGDASVAGSDRAA